MMLGFANCSPAQWPRVLASVLLAVVVYAGHSQSDLRFVLASEVPTAESARAIATGDFNGDGRPDFVYGNYFFPPFGDSIVVALGAGDGTFHSISNYLIGRPDLGFSLYLRKVATADVNRDGLTDVLAAFGWENSRVAVFTGTNGGALFRQPDVMADRYCSSLDFGDFNGDGHLDFVVNGYLEKHIVIHFGNGQGAFPTSTILPLPFFASTVAAADVNGDGRPDILAGIRGNYIGSDGSVGLPSVLVLWNRPGGNFNTRTSIQLNHRFSDSEPTAITVADFNTDGWLDIVAGVDEGSGLTVALQRAGVFTVLTNEVLGGESIQSAAVADFNGDGVPDLVTDRHYFVGKGNGEFIPSLPWGPDERSVSLAVADVNRDGRPDLLRAISCINCLTNDTRPKLRIEKAENHTRVSWPAWLGFTLKAAPDLLPNTAWTVVNEDVMQANGRNMVVHPMESPARFFRLEGN